MSDEYRVKVSVRNNLIIAAIEALGFRSTAAFCRHYGLDDGRVSSLIAFRKAPITASGSFCTEAKELMEALGCAPSDIWTDAQLNMRLERNGKEFVVDESAVRFLADEHADRQMLPDPADILDQKQTAAMVDDLLNTLTPRQKKVIQYRYGLDGNDEELTLDETGKVFDVTRERIRQIESGSMRKLRHPRNQKIIDGKMTSEQLRNSEDA